MHRQVITPLKDRSGTMSWWESRPSISSMFNSYKYCELNIWSCLNVIRRHTWLFHILRYAHAFNDRFKGDTKYMDTHFFFQTIHDHKWIFIDNHNHLILIGCKKALYNNNITPVIKLQPIWFNRKLTSDETFSTFTCISCLMPLLKWESDLGTHK